MDRNGFLDRVLANSNAKAKLTFGKLPSSIKNDLYYNPPSRTGDLLQGSNLGNLVLGGNVVRDFGIAESKISFDSLASTILNQISNDIGKIPLDNLPDQNDITSKSIDKILETFASDQNASGLKRKLQTDKRTGILIQVARKLEASKLDPVNRNVLSRENLFMYTAYRAIVGLGVSDMDGIISAITDSISKVKAELNRRLAKQVILQNNLTASEALIVQIQENLAKSEISYAPGAVKEQVLEVYNQLKNSGGILGLINDFLDSDVVKIPDDMSREDVIQNMLSFLIEIGFATEEEVEEEEPEIEIPKDNFDRAIKGIGPSIQTKLYDSGILTYGQLAEASPEALRIILPGTITDEKISNILRQAKLAQDGRFEELLDFQNVDSGSKTSDSSKADDEDESVADSEDEGQIN